MTLHGFVLVLHGAFRWVVLGAGLVAVGRVARGAIARRSWTTSDTRVLRVFVSAFDAQILLGLVLYLGTSPLGIRMLGHADIAMKSSVLRFFALEHVVGMLTAATVLHLGVTRAARLGESSARHRTTVLVVGLAFTIVLASIPWPIFPYARPLLRLP